MKLKASTRNCKYFDSVKVKFLKSETSTKEMPGARGPGVGLQFPNVNCAGAVYPLGLTQSLSERWNPGVGLIQFGRFPDPVPLLSELIPIVTGCPLAKVTMEFSCQSPTTFSQTPEEAIRCPFPIGSW